MWLCVTERSSIPLSELQPNSPSKRRTMPLHNRPQYGAVRTSGANLASCLSPPPFQPWQETAAPIPQHRARSPIPTATPPAAPPVSHRLSRFGSAEKPKRFAGAPLLDRLDCADDPTTTSPALSAERGGDDDLIATVAARASAEIHGYVDSLQKWPCVADMLSSLEG